MPYNSFKTSGNADKGFSGIRLHFLNLRVVLFSFTFALLSQSYSQSKISLLSGNWNNPLIWSPLGVPTSADDVLISNGTTITFNSNGSCNSLTVGTGSGLGASIQYSGGTARTLSVQNTFLVNSNGSVLILNTSNTTHSLQLNGDLINNGSFDMNRDGNSRCRVVFVKNGNQSISGSGLVSDFYQLVLNMGNTNSNVLDVSSNVFTVPTNFLQLINGTFRVSSPNAVSLVPYTTASSIPSTAGIWLNSAFATMSTSNSITFSGLVRVSSGTLNIGNANNEDLISSSGTLDLNGGVLNIAGKLNASSSAINFSMTGGTLNVPSVQSNNNSVHPIHISVAGSQFNMSGGTIVVQREGGNGNQNLGFLNTGSGSGSVTGGTLQFGDVSTPANQQFQINSNFPVPTLFINSTNATVQLSTNSLQVTGDVVINSGTLNDNNLTIGLSGNWNNNGGSYLNSNGTVIFNSASSAQNLFKSGGETFNNLQFTGAGIKTFSSAVTAKGFSISNGASVDVSSSNHALNLTGNFINSGNFNSRNGNILLNGTSLQTIGGSSTTDFYNLTLNATVGANLSAGENLLNVLSINNGTFNTNGQNFTMVSTASNTARVAQITGSGDILGNVTVQRFIPGGATGWALMGSPISSALTLQDWDDDIFISCSTCPDGSAGGFSSVYTYNEAATGLVDDPASYSALSGISDPIVFGKGYWVYLGNSQFTTTAITVDVSGTLRKFNQTIPLSYNNYGSPADDGWNLIHNPYPSPISWNALRGSTNNLDNAIYVYNADLNAGLGGYATFVNGVSLPAPGVGGISDEIPMAQGFYVHSTGATSLAATESIKINSNPVFLKSMAVSNNTSTALLRLQLFDLQLRDECVVYQVTNASPGFDKSFDAYKLAGTDPLAPTIALVSDTVLLAINGIPVVSGSYSAEVKVTTGVSGNFTLTATDYDGFPKGACLRLFDRFTNTTHDLKSGPIAVWLYDSTVVARFVLSIELNSLSATTFSLPPNCSNENGGWISAMGNSPGPWNYTWKNQSGQIIQQHNLSTSVDSLKNLSGGVYHLEINTAGACDVYNTSFTLPSIVKPQAQFSCADSLNLDETNWIQFNNISLNPISHFWDFGDGSTSVNHSPLHHYTLPGSYQVLYIAESATACKDSSYKQLLVYSKPTGIGETKIKVTLLLKTLGEKKYELHFPSGTTGEVKLELSDGTGKMHWKNKTQQLANQHLELNFISLADGVYYLKISGNNFHEIKKLLVF